MQDFAWRYLIQIVAFAHGFMIGMVLMVPITIFDANRGGYDIITESLSFGIISLIIVQIIMKSTRYFAQGT